MIEMANRFQDAVSAIINCIPVFAYPGDTPEAVEKRYYHLAHLAGQTADQQTGTYDTY